MKPIARKTNIVVQETNLETLVYDLAINKAFLLNEISAFVWQNCNGEKEVSEISETLSKCSKQPINENIVWLAIEQLKNNNLIENAEELESGFEGLSRREIVKKIGFGSIMAIPLISTIVAPTAATAQSGAACVTTNNPCIFANSTQSNCCPNFRCDNLPPAICRPCSNTGTGFGSGTTVVQCNALGTKNLCCNSAGTPTISGGACLCP